MADLAPEDIAAVIAAAPGDGADEAAARREGTRAMARYGISPGPAAGKTAAMRPGFVRRVEEIAREDGSYWRAVPQAVHEWSGEAATPAEMERITAMYLLCRGDARVTRRVTRDMAGAAAGAL